MEHLFLMFLDHTQRRTTVGRTPLDERSARRRDLYLTTHDTHNRHLCSFKKSHLLHLYLYILSFQHGAFGNGLLFVNTTTGVFTISAIFLYFPCAENLSPANNISSCSRKEFSNRGSLNRSTRLLKQLSKANILFLLALPIWPILPIKRKIGSKK